MELESPGTQRIFFALLPDDEVRAGLALAARRMHRKLHGRRICDDNFHMTLAFVGEIDIEDIERLLSPPSSIAAGSFSLMLDHWDCWPRNGIGWAGPSFVPVKLERLATNLGNWLRGMGYNPPRKFTPHVTLVRDAQFAAMPEPLQPVHWQIREFALVRSLPAAKGRRYEVARCWPLE